MNEWLENGQIKKGWILFESNGYFMPYNTNATQDQLVRYIDNFATLKERWEQFSPMWCFYSNIRAIAMADYDKLIEHNKQNTLLGE